jgi:Putative zinc-finger
MSKETHNQGSRSLNGLKAIVSDVPKIVRQRLAKAPVTPHPDANLLSAFLEPALTPGERVRVLEHLAHCSHCREAASLAAPEAQPQRAIVDPVKPAWLRWPALQWGAAVACVVVVSTAVLLQRDKLERDRITTFHPPRSEAVLAPPAASNASPEGGAEKRRLIEGNQRSASSPVAEPFMAKPERRKGPARESSRMPGMPVHRDTPGALAAASPVPPEPSAQEPPTERARAAMLGATGATSAHSAKETVEVSPLDMVAPPAAAKDAAQTQPATGALHAYANSPVFQKAQVVAVPRPGSDWRKLSALPRWSLRPDGVLQRSLDAGKTWSPVEVPGSVAAFRAVAAIGPSVWAGGGGGQLYHSSDAGIHWSQVVPAAEAGPLTADIVRIEFTTTREGKLTTSDGELWTTSDAGETWNEGRP